MLDGLILPYFTDYRDLHKFVDENFSSKNHTIFGIHSNVKINHLTSISEYLFQKLSEIESSEISGEVNEQSSREEKV